MPALSRPSLPSPAVLATLVISSVLAIALTVAVLVHPDPLGPDAGWLQWFVDHRDGTMTAIFKVISAMGDTTTMGLVAVAACGLLAWRKLWETAAFVGFTALGTGVLIFGAKLLIGRDRPPVVDHLVVETNHSYPSGHTMGATAIVGVLVALVLPLLRGIWRSLLVAIAAFFVLAVAASRLYLGVHWPTDVLAGWIFGTLWLTLCLTFRPTLTDGYRVVLTKVARN